MNLIQILFGQIPEAIYFAMFIILVKDLKTRRIPFILLMILEYIFLKYFLVYTTWFQVMYFILAFVIMKILYRDECNVTNIFTMGIASVILIVIGLLSYVCTLGIIPIFIIVNRLLMFGVLFVFRNKLKNINNLYKKLWNRSKIKYKMKSTTFRALNLVVFNISFFVINLGVLFHNLYWR